jgi:hypothetical protein
VSAAFVLDNLITSRWAGSAAEEYIHGLWPPADRGSFLTLNETQAAPGTPLPRVIYEIGAEDIRLRMSGKASKKFHSKEFPLSFAVTAEQAEVEGQVLSSKEIARQVVERLLALFGGHPEFEPSACLAIEIGCITNFMYSGSFGIQEDDLIYTFRVNYQISIDFPVQV